MQGLGGAQLWHENNFLLCEASVNLGITKCKISSQYATETTPFCVDYTNCKPRYVMIQDIYSWLDLSRWTEHLSRGLRGSYYITGDERGKKKRPKYEWSAGKQI